MAQESGSGSWRRLPGPSRSEANTLDQDDAAQDTVRRPSEQEPSDHAEHSAVQMWPAGAAGVPFSHPVNWVP